MLQKLQIQEGIYFFIMTHNAVAWFFQGLLFCPASVQSGFHEEAKTHSSLVSPPPSPSIPVPRGKEKFSHSGLAE